MELSSIKSKPELRGIRAELALLRTRWPTILGCLLMQYCHGVFTQLAYRMHTPAPQPLHDLGFSTLPELPAEWRWLSEALFTFLFVSFLLWTFSPLMLPRSSFSCVLVWTRLLTVLVVCQALRIISFSSTQLPGPAPHCRLGTPTAHRAPAQHWWQHVVVDVGRQLGHSCGDLIFSSHMTFILMGVLTYQHYGCSRVVKALSWTAAVLLAGLIIAARKHYTVDVVIAWYTVPLVYCCLNMYWSRQQQQQQLLLQANPPCSAAAAAAAAAGGSIFYSPCSTGVHSGCGQCDTGSSSCCCCYSPRKNSTLQPLAPQSYSPCSTGSPEHCAVELGLLHADTASAVVVDCHSGGTLCQVGNFPGQLSIATPRTPTAAAAAAQGGDAQEGSWPLLTVCGHRRVGSNSSSTSSGRSGSSGNSWGPYGSTVGDSLTGPVAV